MSVLGAKGCDNASNSPGPDVDLGQSEVRFEPFEPWERRLDPRQTAALSLWDDLL